MKRIFMLAVTCAIAPAAAQTPPDGQFSPEQIGRGAETFAVYCSPCHGERMSSPEFFNLKTFPPDQHSRFVNSVTNGKNAMPPWGSVLKHEDIEALWAYVLGGEKSP